MRTSEGFGGRTALVTGAAGGMGLEACRRLGAEAVRVYGVDMRAPEPGEVPADAVFEIGDAGDERLMSALAARAVAETGRLDYLVNAAGVLWFDRDTSLTTIDPEVWNEVLRINLTAAMIAARGRGAAHAPRRRRDGARVVDPVLPRRRPAAGCLPGREGGVTRPVEVDRDPVRGRRHPIERRGARPHPLADAAAVGRGPGEGAGNRSEHSARAGRHHRAISREAILYLLSDRADWITGVELIVDGGLLARP